MYQQICDDIGRFLNEAGQIYAISSPKGVAKDNRDWYARCMVTFALINRTLDLGFFVLEIYRYTDPDGPVRYKAMIKRLCDHHLIDNTTRDGMIALIEQRNRISHHFHEIGPGELVGYDEITTIVASFTCAMQHAYAQHTTRTMIRRGFLAAGIVSFFVGVLLWFFWA